MTTATTFVPTVAEATAAGFFPSRHEVEVVAQLSSGVWCRKWHTTGSKCHVMLGIEYM